MVLIFSSKFLSQKSKPRTLFPKLHIKKEKLLGKKKNQYFRLFLNLSVKSNHLCFPILSQKSPRLPPNTHKLYCKFSVMEVSSSVKSQYPRIRLSYNAYCFIDSKRKPILNCQLNFNFPGSFHHIKGQRLVLNSSYSEGGPISELGLENMPLSVELEPISSESQFDRVVAEAHQLEESVIVLW
ncbi:hypothetical protein CDL12_24111 [Handroanthus impetiginosus]|uniref:Uncharacterized protein n=1 Tax=Handroanthus impetiginosus TaxID=429701 RepID=A0A2G9GEC0_9LAMI|nr:hypothetical protein CDL12_24111 [Handroanthus impetiginosus]